MVSGFHASRAIEVDRKIENLKLFKDCFRNIEPLDDEHESAILTQLAKVRENFSRIVLDECFETIFYQSIGCRARCPGCGMKCELPAKIDPSEEEEEHHHSTQYHLPMVFHGWPRDKEFGLIDLENYHSGIYPTSIVSLPNHVDLLWESL
jgi:hypothetical protein